VLQMRLVETQFLLWILAASRSNQDKNISNPKDFIELSFEQLVAKYIILCIARTLKSPLTTTTSSF
jgi:hypothetical protein